jgi:hypothetical protein
MRHPHDIPLCEASDLFAWNPDEIRDLIHTTPLVYDADGLPVGYDASQLFGLEAAYIRGRM